MIAASNIPKYLYVFHSLSVPIFPDFGCLIPFIICHFPLFLLSMTHFSMPNSISTTFLWPLNRVCLLVGIYGRSWIFLTSNRLCHHGLVFSNLVFFSVVLSEFSPLVLLRVFLTLFPCCLSTLVFGYVPLVTISSSKIVLLPWHLVVGMFRVISPYMLVNYFFLVLECHVFLYCFTLSRKLFNFPSLVRTFWFISSSCLSFFLVLFFSALPQHVPAFFQCFIIFAFCRSFLIGISSWISYPGFEFMLVFLWGN